MSKTEQMLSDMAHESEAREALQRGLTVAEYRALQRRCAHVWENRGYYDECSKCGAGSA